jgi:acetyl esterase/lipase
VDEPRSRIGIIYSHGSGWRVGDKDMLTRPFFRQLVGQGHVLLDIAYSLYPEADLPSMVQEVNQAILWMKNNSQQLQIDPERIVLIGASAGAHLSLLAAYAQGQPEFQPASASSDTSVRGVVAYYPPVDLQNLHASNQDSPAKILRPVEEMANAMLSFIFNLGPRGLDQEPGKKTEFNDLLVEMLGGTVEEIPQVYALLSPINHIHKNCPATLILQGSDDVFDLAPPVRRFHRALQESGVPVILVEYPHAEHGFDLFFPQISPVAQAATREVERFLELMT